MEHLAELWQQAKIDESRMDRTYRTDDLVPMIARLEKRQERLLAVKTLGSVVILAALLIVFLNRMTLSLFSLMGIGIFTVSLLTIVILLNRLRFRITHEERSFSTLQLAGVAESKIRKERMIFTTYLPLFFVVAMIGFNLMYLDYFNAEESGTRILYHVIMTASLTLAFVAGISVRIKRFHRQFLPVLDRINRFRDESSEEDGSYQEK
jgi:hypothetical protein